MKNSLSNFSPSTQAWRGAAVGIFIATLFLISLSTIDLFQNNDVSLGDATIYFVAGSLITALVGAMLVFIGVLFANISALSKWAIACFALIVYYFFIPTQTSSGLILIGIWTIISFSLTCGSLWSLIIDRNENKGSRAITLASLLAGLLGIFLLAFWLYSTPKNFSPPTHFDSNNYVKAIDLPDPSLKGSLQVKKLTYGSGNHRNRTEYGKETSIITPTTDGELFITGWKGLSGFLRTRYWGFDSSKIPLNGHVWYPEGKGPFPLVLIVHGNHEMSAASEKGYGYLGELFASRGFITVSIDQNFLNGGWIDFTGSINEAAARGWLILEHLKLWREWNDSEHSPLSKKIDLKKIALIGHSRGGEAIATAAAFNDLNYFPGNGNIAFDYHFNILALAAIAPVDSQYTPGGQHTSLDNIDYFMIQGDQDWDVRSFEGTGQYNRIHFFDSHYHFKASLYVVGANHGQFNSLWGKNDMQLPTSLLFNKDHILPEKDQQLIAKIYLSAFLEATLHKKIGYLPLFHTWKSGKEWLPKTVYYNEFADSNETYIINDDETIDIGKTTLSEGTAKGEGLKIWRQGQIILREGNAIHTGTFLGWKNDPSTKKYPNYTITLPPDAISINSSSVLVLSLANSSHDENEDEDIKDYESKGPIDFTLQLTDSQGEKASLLLSDAGFLQPALKQHVMKSDFLDPLEGSESIFQTFEFPIKDFIAKNPKLNPEKLTSIGLIFNRTSRSLIILQSVSIRNEG